MVNPKRSKRRSRGRLNRRIHSEQAVFVGPASPASTLSFGYGQFIQYLHTRPFQFRRITIVAAALDVASANKLTLGPAHFQIRQLIPIPVVSNKVITADVTMIKSSRVFTVGMNPKTFRFNCHKFRYPAETKLEAFFALDVLCPAKGYEIGIHYNMTFEINIFHEYESETCPSGVSQSTILFNSRMLGQ